MRRRSLLITTHDALLHRLKKSRAENDVIDRNKDELDEEPDETHDDEPGRRSRRDLPKLPRVGFGALFYESDRVFREVSHRFHRDVRHFHCNVFRSVGSLMREAINDAIEWIESPDDGGKREVFKVRGDGTSRR